MNTPYNSFARARKIGDKRERRIKSEKIAAIQQWAKGSGTLPEVKKK